MSEWQKDLSISANIFMEKVAPLFLSVYGGELLHMETVQDSNFARKLDMLSGIDAWHICNGNIRGIASRVQWGNPNSNGYPYNTFTIRKQRDTGAKTEYAKRKETIESHHGWIYPYLTIQAYTNNEYELLSFALAKTSNIIKAIDNENYIIKRTSNASFFILDWTTDLCEIVYKNSKIMTTRPLITLASESSHSVGWLYHTLK